MTWAERSRMPQPLLTAAVFYDDCVFGDGEARRVVIRCRPDWLEGNVQKEILKKCRCSQTSCPRGSLTPSDVG